MVHHAINHSYLIINWIFSYNWRNSQKTINFEFFIIYSGFFESKKEQFFVSKNWRFKGALNFINANNFNCEYFILIYIWANSLVWCIWFLINKFLTWYWTNFSFGFNLISNFSIYANFLICFKWISTCYELYLHIKVLYF